MWQVHCGPKPAVYAAADPYHIRQSAEDSSPSEAGNLHISVCTVVVHACNVHCTSGRLPCLKHLTIAAVQQVQTASSSCHDSDNHGHTASPYTSPSMQLEIAQGQQLPNVAACAMVSAADGPTVCQRRTAQRVQCFVPACMHVNLFIWDCVRLLTVCRACKWPPKHADRDDWLHQHVCVTCSSSRFPRPCWQC
jgi:hypothetical protein